MKQLLRYSLLAISILACMPQVQAQDAIKELQAWLAKPEVQRPALDRQPFAQKALTRQEADRAMDLLAEDYSERFLAEFGSQWDRRLMEAEGLQMPFYGKAFGPMPTEGYPLYISLHGGGGAPAATNDQQYRNQQHLYDATMKDLQGIYVAPRAPTNTWDLWHQAHIDLFLDRLIQLATLKAGVDPNRIYLLGYSAGGDGVYQLAPRMADRFAAASMMAGHPNETQATGLRNLPFALHMGGRDGAYNRNQVAKEWGERLDELQAEDPEGYIHQVQIHEGKGHWMELEDAVALPWMSNFRRQQFPSKVAWRQDDVRHTRLYWLGAPDLEPGKEVIATVDREANEINILKAETPALQFYLHDDLLDLNKPVRVHYQGRVLYQGVPNRTILHLHQNLEEYGMARVTSPAVIEVAL